MAKMASLHAELTELPDEAKDFMQGFYRGRAEGIEVERERIIQFLKSFGYFIPVGDVLTLLTKGETN